MSAARKEALAQLRVAVASAFEARPNTPEWQQAHRTVALAQVHALDAGATAAEILDASEGF